MFRILWIFLYCLHIGEEEIKGKKKYSAQYYRWVVVDGTEKLIVWFKFTVILHSENKGIIPIPQCWAFCSPVMISL